MLDGCELLAWLLAVDIRSDRMCSSSHIRQILSDTSQFHREATVQGAAAASPSASGFKLFKAQAQALA